MRRVPAVLAGLLTVALGVAATAPVSAASWADREWVASPVAALECGDPDTVDATAWGRMLTGSLGGESLDPVAALAGIEVSNLDPATTSTASPSGATGLGDDAWTSALTLSTLGTVSTGPGVLLPFGTSTGVVTQYGRATSTGLAVGASGAVTTGGGVAALESPGSTTPRLATLQLSTLLDSALPGLGLTPAQLADVQLRMGSLGAIAAVDSCGPLWSGEAPGDALEREYLVDDLALDLTSSRVTDLAASVDAALASLESTIDGLDYVTTTLPSGLLSALTSVLGALSGTPSLAVALDIDLDPVRALLTDPLTDGAVSVDLSTGRVSLDLEALFGAAYSSSSGLNGQPANTPVLTPEVLAAVSGRVGALLTTLLGTTIPAAITTAIENATVEVEVVVRAVLVILPVTITLGFSGTVGGFTGVAGHEAPDVESTPSLGGLLDGIVATVLPAVGSTVVAPLAALASSAASTTITGLTSTTLPDFLDRFGDVLAALGALVDLTVNAQPDAPGSVGAPAAAPPGRYFETALHVGVVDGSTASVASFFVASASVGPNALRP